jgi:hypothetical protein
VARWILRKRPETSFRDSGRPRENGAKLDRRASEVAGPVRRPSPGGLLHAPRLPFRLTSNAPLHWRRNSENLPKSRNSATDHTKPARLWELPASRRRPFVGVASQQRRCASGPTEQAAEIVYQPQPPFARHVQPLQNRRRLGRRRVCALRPISPSDVWPRFRPVLRSCPYGGWPRSCASAFSPWGG